MSFQGAALKKLLKLELFISHNNIILLTILVISSGVHLKFYGIKIYFYIEYFHYMIVLKLKFHLIVIYCLFPTKT